MNNKLKHLDWLMRMKEIPAPEVVLAEVNRSDNDKTIELESAIDDANEKMKNYDNKPENKSVIYNEAWDAADGVDKIVAILNKATIEKPILLSVLGGRGVGKTTTMDKYINKVGVGEFEKIK